MSGINKQLFADDTRSNMTRLSLPMPMAWHEFVTWIGEAHWKKRKKERQGVYGVLMYLPLQPPSLTLQTH
jgi:hypothetical protein